MLSIKKVKADKQHRYVVVSVWLENQGLTIVRPGTLFGRMSSDGAVRIVEFRNSSKILPGSIAKVTQLFAEMTQLEFTNYRQSDEVIVPFTGGIVRRLSFFDSVAEVTEQWWKEILLPRTRFISAQIKALQDRQRLRLAKTMQKSKHRDQEERQAWESVDAVIMRWWDEVLLPRSKSIGAHIKRRFAKMDARSRH